MNGRTLGPTLAALAAGLLASPAAAALARVGAAPLFAPPALVAPVALTALPAAPLLAAPSLPAAPSLSVPAAAPVAAPALAALPAASAAALPSVRPGTPTQSDPGRSVFDGAAAPVDAFVAAAAASVPADAAPRLEKHLRRVLEVGRHGRYEESPGVQRMLARIERGGSLDHDKGFHLRGSTELEDGVLTLTVHSVHHRPHSRFSKAMRVGPDQQPVFSTAYPRMMYALIEGAARRAASDPRVKTVRIVGWKVMNPRLRTLFSALGFVPSRPPAESALWPVDWTLTVPVR